MLGVTFSGQKIITNFDKGLISASGEAATWMLGGAFYKQNNLVIFDNLRNFIINYFTS